MKFEPLHDRVYIKVRPLPEKTGSIIRVNQQEFAREADVIAVGPEVRDVEPGQGVLVSLLAFQPVGDNYVGPEGAVLAYLEEE